MTDVKPGDYGFTKFCKVAAVDQSAFWVTAAGTSSDGGVIYFERGKPGKAFYLNAADPTVSYIVVAGAGSLEDTAYCVMQTTAGSDYIYALWVLKATGETTRFDIPAPTGYGCDGLAVNAPGEARVMMSPGSGGAGSRLYSFKAGTFTLVATYPTRVVLSCYSSPSEGWGHNYGSTIYQLLGASYVTHDIQGKVNGIGMVNGNDGWAVGSYNGQPQMWHYTSSRANVVPASLGRVKATFK